MAQTIPTAMMQGYSPPEWDAILTAAMKNDSLGIRRLITEAGVSPNHANAVAQSALHIAALWGNVESVQELLKHKAEPNAQNRLTGATPLHCVVQSTKGVKARRMQCMELLIANGADVSVTDFFGKVAAEYCEGDSEIAQKLQPQKPALFQAIQDGNVEEVKKLVSTKTDDNTQATHEEKFMGETPFQRALNMLLADEEGEGGMSQQIDHSKVMGILKVLLEAGANTNPESPNKNPMDLENPTLPPLYRVCEVLENAYKNQNDDTALLEEACRLLLQHKAAVTPELQQMLHTACRKNELKFAKLLIEVVQVDPNIKGRQGMTPLQFAARSGKTQMVQYLLSLPTININIPDDRGQTALDAARVNNKEDVVALLEAFSSKG